MTKNDTTSAIVDGILKAAVITGGISMALIAPNIIKYLDPATKKFLKNLDERSKEREIRRCLVYALRESLITEHYQHGIEISKKGQRRLKKAEYNGLVINNTNKWDNSWRLVFFDIPALKNKNRAQFTRKLRQLGFQPLQQSIWIIPYECKNEVAFVTETLGISKFVTYITTRHIDHEDLLKKRFSLK